MQTLRNNRRLTPAIITILFLVIVLIVIAPTAWQQIQTALPRELTEVTCFIGSEKDDFLSNETVTTILANRYGLEVDFTNMGSIEQAYLDRSRLSATDCLWPSNTSALEIFRANNQQAFNAGSYEHETIFNSPIVFYSWTPIVDALQSEGLVAQEADHWVTDTADFVDLLVSEERPTWNELGVEDLYNGFNLITTDPVRSNSGNMFYGLLLNMLNGGQVADLGTLNQHLPTIEAYYNRQGLLIESSGILFDDFISRGMGANPMIANYESLIIEFSVQNQESLDLIRDQIRVIYPQPTVWSAHPMIALTDEGSQLIEALRDPELQTIAWEQHGFRTGLIGVSNDPAVLAIAGIPAEVRSVMNLPQPQAMIEMVEQLSS